MKNQILASLFILAALASCNSKEKESADTDTTLMANMDHSAHHMPVSDQRTKELMAIHDSIMPSMGTIMDLKAKISVEIKRVDSLSTLKSTDELKTRKAQALKIKSELDKADQEMMGWMHQYKADTLETLDSVAAASYVKDQKTKIETVRDQMEQSIQKAKEFVEKK